MNKLQKMKMRSKETCEEIIWDLLEDRLELSEETKRNIEISRQQYKEGKLKTLEQIKKGIGL